uniref:Mediator of RNA polymerase II transcription subunit 31 n=1 Tax=Chromera velia CCMP2878 TaxID=1169474 RepID=A0A0G4HGK7_9ALVE|eukprot:Cvel_6735.t1-p1 / transcript=Cvel_6735.t1 / gene=Cvel_6735 / organism=Chromera_velia_CCMP2878 / gene_product=Mediator of RNA polymerase II transcription subunit, putative / transcript_product=Mediator of RNA polymerase II transcription subunit, putative / location=Cvel_scaffold337:19077-21827(+) / protein_length=165 / sequence_SO=supercontig / SO=protein_coding / is_pseudo=false
MATQQGTVAQPFTVDSLTRLNQELEFVECLANVDYLHWLAKQRYLEKPEFVRYLKYLLYWTKPPYVFRIVYPHALGMLTALQDEKFRKCLSDKDGPGLIKDDQATAWITAEQPPLKRQKYLEALRDLQTKGTEEVETQRQSQVEIQEAIAAWRKAVQEKAAQDLS